MNDGILLIDKPAGMSSFGVVARVRRKLSEAAGYVEIKGKDGVVRQKRKKVKVGHTGTLDPFATGLLLILTGKETKRANEFLKLDKEYVATIRLGATSTTGDIEGEIKGYMSDNQSLFFSGHDVASARRCGGRASSSSAVASGDSQKAQCLVIPMQQFACPSISQVEEVVQSFVGEIEQTVPQYSAVKINGQRAYKLAREGRQVEMPRRKIQIYEIEILRYEWPELTLRCKVSSGTYIRTLGEDIGNKLGVGGYLTALRRTEVGEYRVDDAMILEEYLSHP